MKKNLLCALLIFAISSFCSAAEPVGNFLLKSGDVGTGNFKFINNGHITVGSTEVDNPLTVFGTIESKSGGFKFPNGSIMVSGGITGETEFFNWVSTYEPGITGEVLFTSWVSTYEQGITNESQFLSWVSSYEPGITNESEFQTWVTTYEPGITCETAFYNWLAQPPLISAFTNDLGYITGESGFNSWLAGPPSISTFTNDSGYITNETNFNSWVSSYEAGITNEASFEAWLANPVLTNTIEAPSFIATGGIGYASSQWASGSGNGAALDNFGNIILGTGFISPSSWSVVDSATGNWAISVQASTDAVVTTNNILDNGSGDATVAGNLSVESVTFPDGSIQTTAGGSGGEPLWISFEAKPIFTNSTTFENNVTIQGLGSFSMSTCPLVFGGNNYDWTQSGNGLFYVYGASGHDLIGVSGSGLTFLQGINGKEDVGCGGISGDFGGGTIYASFYFPSNVFPTQGSFDSFIASMTGGAATVDFYTNEVWAYTGGQYVWQNYAPIVSGYPDPATLEGSTPDVLTSLNGVLSLNGLVFPTTDEGIAGYVMSTDGNGNLTFEAGASVNYWSSDGYNISNNNAGGVNLNGIVTIESNTPGLFIGNNSLGNEGGSGGALTVINSCGQSNDGIRFLAQGNTGNTQVQSNETASNYQTLGWNGSQYQLMSQIETKSLGTIESGAGPTELDFNTVDGGGSINTGLIVGDYTTGLGENNDVQVSNDLIVHRGLQLDHNSLYIHNVQGYSSNGILSQSSDWIDDPINGQTQTGNQLNNWQMSGTDQNGNPSGGWGITATAAETFEDTGPNRIDLHFISTGGNGANERMRFGHDNTTTFYDNCVTIEGQLQVKAAGSSPIIITSSAEVANLNVNYLEGHPWSDVTGIAGNYVLKSGDTVSGSLTVEGQFDAPYTWTPTGSTTEDVFASSHSFIINNSSGYSLSGDYPSLYSQITAQGTGSINSVYGILGKANNAVNMGSPNIGGVTNLWGMFYDVDQATDNSSINVECPLFARALQSHNGTVNNMIAGWFTVDPYASGSVGTAEGLDVRYINRGTTTLTNAYGINLSTQLPAFTNNNQLRIGLNIPDMPTVDAFVGCTDYSIKTGTGTVLLGGDLQVSGNISIPTSEAASGVIYQNGTPLISTYGAGNLFIGNNAGNFTTTGTGGNIGIGLNTMHVITNGLQNVAIGENALYANLTGSSNTAIGTGAMEYNDTGGANTAIGNGALFANTSGGNNVAIGENSLSSNTTNSQSVAIGYDSLAVSSGAGNIGLGYMSGRYETGDHAFYVNDIDQNNTTQEKSNSLMYGTMAGSAATQRMRINALTGINCTPDASAMLTVAGTIESILGGVKFPDGSIQTTAVSNGIKYFDKTVDVNGGGDYVSMTTAFSSDKLGDSTTSFTITNTSGNTYRYTYNGTGTDPLITATSVPAGGRVGTYAQNFNVANQGVWFVTGSGANYFEVTNPAGVAEANKTIGTGVVNTCSRFYVASGNYAEPAVVFYPGQFIYFDNVSNTVTISKNTGGTYNTFDATASPYLTLGGKVKLTANYTAAASGISFDGFHFASDNLDLSDLVIDVTGSVYANYSTGASNCYFVNAAYNDGGPFTKFLAPRMIYVHDLSSTQSNSAWVSLCSLAVGHVYYTDFNVKISNVAAANAAYMGAYGILFSDGALYNLFNVNIYGVTGNSGYVYGVNIQAGSNYNSVVGSIRGCAVNLVNSGTGNNVAALVN